MPPCVDVSICVPVLMLIMAPPSARRLSPPASLATATVKAGPFWNSTSMCAPFGDDATEVVRTLSSAAATPGLSAGGDGPGAGRRRRLSPRPHEWHTLRGAAAPVSLWFEGEHSMSRQFFVGLFITLGFGVVVLAALFGIFTLVSYLAGPVGG